MKIRVEIIKKKHFLFNNYCSTYTLKFFTVDNTDSPSLFLYVTSKTFTHGNYTIFPALQFKRKKLFKYSIYT